MQGTVIDSSGLDSQYNEAREAAAAAYRKSVSGLKDGPSRQERMAQREAAAWQAATRPGRFCNRSQFRIQLHSH